MWHLMITEKKNMFGFFQSQAADWHPNSSAVEYLGPHLSFYLEIVQVGAWKNL